MMNLREIKQSVRALSPSELAKLDIWLHKMINIKQSKQREQSIAKASRTPQKTYRLEFIQCGKETCKCRKGDRHGPYWYAYWSENGKTRAQYIGKKLHKKTRHRNLEHKV